MQSVDAHNKEVQWVLDSTQKMHDEGKVRGIIVTIITPEGGFAYAKALNLSSLVEAVGVLEATKVQIIEGVKNEGVFV